MHHRQFVCACCAWRGFALHVSCLYLPCFLGVGGGAATSAALLLLFGCSHVLSVADFVCQKGVGGVFFHLVWPFWCWRGETGTQRHRTAILMALYGSNWQLLSHAYSSFRSPLPCAGGLRETKIERHRTVIPTLLSLPIIQAIFVACLGVEAYGQGTAVNSNTCIPCLTPVFFHICSLFG